MKLTLLGERDVPLHRPGVCWVNSWERSQLRGFGDVPMREPALTFHGVPVIFNQRFDEPLPDVDAATVGDVDAHWRGCKVRGCLGCVGVG